MVPQLVIVMNEFWITANNIFQLLGLGPCLLLMFFLLLTIKDLTRAIVPLLFLLSLGAGFVEPLLYLLWPESLRWVHTMLLIMRGMLPAATFLLILQFLRDEVPSFTYWLIVLIPLIGGVMLYYVENHMTGEICVATKQALHCIDSGLIFSLYTVLTGSVILLFIMPELRRAGSILTDSDACSQDKFWLIVALVVFTIGLLALDLMQVGDILYEHQVRLMHTVIMLLFVFLMFASLFRVFSQQFVLDMERIPSARKLLTSEDEQLAEKVDVLLKQHKLYRKMGLSRSVLAEKLEISEAQLSHIINRYFNCNFNVLVNSHRVAEAKDRLCKEPETSITAIAFEVGFNSIASFNRVFKDITGMAPSEWRHKKS